MGTRANVERDWCLDKERNRASNHGPRQNEDGEARQPHHHREVLQQDDFGLRHQQASLRRRCHHPVEEAEEQDRWFRHPPYEAYSARTSEGHLSQAPGGGAEKGDLTTSQRSRPSTPRRSRSTGTPWPCSSPSTWVTFLAFSFSRAEAADTEERGTTTKNKNKEYGMYFSYIV